MINFSPINFVKLNNFKAPQKTFLKPLANDIFTKTISFKGNEEIKNSENEFISWAKENDFLNSELENILLSDENKIGSGFSHSAYSINGNEKYVLRTRNSIDFSSLDFKNAQLKDCIDKNLKINIGQKVAEITVPNNNGYSETLEVLNKVNGESLGIMPASALCIDEFGTLRENEKPFEDIERKMKFQKSIHDVSIMPVESFEKLIKKIIEANEYGYHLDHLNSNNLLVDNESQEINLIDMEKGKRELNLGNILYALTNIYYLSTYMDDKGEKIEKDQINQTIKETIDIIQKFTQAMKNLNLKFDRESCSYEFLNLMNSLPFAFFCKSFDYNGQWRILAQNDLANDY